MLQSTITSIIKTNGGKWHNHHSAALEEAVYQNSWGYFAAFDFEKSGIQDTSELCHLQPVFSMFELRCDEKHECLHV